MKMLTTADDKEPLKWRFYHQSYLPDLGTPDLMQVEDLLAGGQVNGDLGSMHHSGLLDYDFSPGRGSPRAPVKAVHDLSMAFPDTDSGFGSYKSRSRVMEDFSPTLTRLPRSRSLSRLNGLTTQEITDVLHEKPTRHLQTQLEDSEARRTVLMHKLKEAQATLELQNDRLSKIENSAKDNTSLVEDLKFKEREYRKKIAQLQTSEEDKQMLQMENIRLREEMQDRIEMLDFHLKSLQTQHQSSEDENNQRLGLLDQTTSALSLLEQENTKLQMERDKLREEMSVMKEAFQLSKSRYESVEVDHKTQKTETDKLREENNSVNKRVHEMAGQMMELRSLLQAVKDDNKRLSSTVQAASQDKHRASRQVEGYQDTLADLKSRLAAANAEKDRLFQDKMDMNYKLQQLILEKEQLLKSQMVLDEQVEEQQRALDNRQRSNSHQDSHSRLMEEELAAVKRVSEGLSTELASVKAFYERALEQLSLAESGNKLHDQQLGLADQERKRLQAEVDRLSKILDNQRRDDRAEQQHLEDTILKMRSEMKDLKYDKDQLTKTTHELDTKLKKANDEIRGGLGMQHGEVETLRTTCDRLTASVARKETELQNLSDKCHGLERQLAAAEGELRHSREKDDVSADVQEDMERLRDENRRLLQEKAENEQMLQLLETQRDVLTKSTESSMNKLHDVEQLSGKVDQMRNENELLRQRVSELEKLRDNLIKQKEELLASSQAMYKSEGLEELESKMNELRDANKQLRDSNQGMSNKLHVVEQENLKLQQSVGAGSGSSSREEVKRLREENKRLLDESNKLRRENRDYVSQTSKDTDTSAKEVQKIRKERDALSKQVQLINGQLNLLEGSKKRAEDTAQRSQSELTQLRTQLDTSRKECADAKRVATQVRGLSEQLHKAKAQQESQEKLIRSMKEELGEERSKKPDRLQESLEDVGAELQHMSGELHKVMREIENKELIIHTMEKELRAARDTASAKEHTITDLKKLVSDLERQNSTLKVTMDSKHTDSSGDERPPPLMKTGGEKSLKEELEEAVKSKHADISQSKPRSLIIRSKSLIPIKLSGYYPARLTVKDSEGATDKSKPVSSGDLFSSSQTPSLELPTFERTQPIASSTWKPPVPLLPPRGPSQDSAQPSNTSDTSMDASFKSLLSPESYPSTSTPNPTGQPGKKFQFGSELTKVGSAEDSKSEPKSTPHSQPPGGKEPSSGLISFFKKPAERSPERDASAVRPLFGQRKEPVKTDGAKPAMEGRNDPLTGKDTVDFPPITPPTVEHTKPKLAFSKPQPASKSKHRKLPEIRVVSEEKAPEAGKSSHGDKRSDVGRLEVKADTIKHKYLQTTPAQRGPAPKVAPKPKTSPRTSFLSRREMTGTPSKLLSESGVTVIATKTGSTLKSSSDVKYVVKKQETPSEKKPEGSSRASPAADSAIQLKSFDELLSGNGNKRSTNFSGSGSDKLSVSGSGSDKLSVSGSGSDKLTFPLSRPKSPTKIPARRVPFTSSQLASNESISTKPSGGVQAKSSIRDFLASFSPDDAKKDKGGPASSEAKKPGADPLVKPLFSRLSSGKDTKQEPSLHKSASLESFAALLDEPVRLQDDSGKEKGTLNTGPTFGSTLVSSDPWSLLLDEPAGRSSPAGMSSPSSRLDKPASKISAPAGKVAEAKSKATEGSKSSSSSLLRSLSSGGLTDEGSEEGQPLKFRPATGMFLSKSLGHPLSSASSQQGSGASGESGNTSTRQGRYGAMFFSKPDKPGTESGDRLQSLISKYRSHSTDPPSGATSPVGGAKARVSSAPPSARGGSPIGRGFTPGAPKAPLLRPDSSSSSRSDDSSPSKTGKKLPPPPPPKPAKSLMKSLSLEGGARAEGAGQSAEMLDSQEQSDINALIQKPAASGAARTKSLLSVHPPKITSTSKFLKCKREQRK